MLHEGAILTERTKLKTETHCIDDSSSSVIAAIAGDDDDKACSIKKKEKRKGEKERKKVGSKEARKNRSRRGTHKRKKVTQHMCCVTIFTRTLDQEVMAHRTVVGGECRAFTGTRSGRSRRCRSNRRRKLGSAAIFKSAKKPKRDRSGNFIKIPLFA
jgi:hypothetical protein